MTYMQINNNNSIECRIKGMIINYYYLLQQDSLVEEFGSDSLKETIVIITVKIVLPIIPMTAITVTTYT